MTETGAPPAALGITSPAQLTGRRVQLRDGPGTVILEALLPLPGPLSGRALRVVSGAQLVLAGLLP